MCFKCTSYLLSKYNTDFKYTSSSIIQQVEVYLKYTYSMFKVYLKYNSLS